MEEFGARASFGRTEIFPDIDRAIQQAEDELLRVEGHMGAAAMELDDVGLFAGFARQDLQALKSYMTRKSYARDQVVFREGDPGDEVLVVTSGSASAYLHLPDEANIRLATFSPGTVFGELAILDRQALRHGRRRRGSGLLCLDHYRLCRLGGKTAEHRHSIDRRHRP